MKGESRKKSSRKPSVAEAAKSSEDSFRGWLLAAMTALLVARPLYPSESAAAQGDGLPVVMLWLALAVVWLVSVVHKRRVALRFGAVDAAVLALVAWVAASGLYATLHGSPRPSLNMLWEWIGLGSVYFLARQLVVTPRESRAVVAAIIALMTAISIYGIYQYAIELPALQTQFKTEGDAMLKEAGVSYPLGTPLRDLLEKRLASRAAIGTFAESNSLAAAIAPWLVIGVGLAIGAWMHKGQRFGWLACLAPLAVALALTKSRSGLIAAAIGVLFLMARRLRFRPRYIAVGAAITCITLAVALYAFHNQSWFSRAATSFSFRLQYWRSTMAMIRQRPWLGCGPGNFQDVYMQFKLPEASEEVADPHNFLLEVWATAGTPALVALLVALALFTSNVTRRRDIGENVSYEGDRSKLIPFGVFGGFLLALPLGQICYAPPSMAVTLIGLPVAGACLWLLLPWIREGKFPPGVAALGVAVLLIDLSTTEGIGIPAIAETLWLLLALGLNSCSPREAPRWVVAALLAVGLGLTIACFQTSYSRVLPCQSFLKIAERDYLDGQLTDARDAAERAVRADPRSSGAFSLLAQVELDLWLQNRDAAGYAAFELHDTRARQLAPESNAVWHGSAMRYQKAFGKTDDRGRPLAPEALAHALASARRAVELYPNSSFEHATLAALYEQAGDAASFQREAQAAIRLDDAMTHEDKKLSAELRRKLEAATVRAASRQNR